MMATEITPGLGYAMALRGLDAEFAVFVHPHNDATFRMPVEDWVYLERPGYLNVEMNTQPFRGLVSNQIPVVRGE